MEFIKNLLRKFRKPKTSALNIVPKFQNEDEYYSWFFTQNEDWNKTTPNSDEQLRWNGIKTFMEEIKKEKTETLRILDIGCGRGWLTNLLAGYGAVKGIEPVAPVVKYANTIFPDLDIVTGNSDTLLNNGYAEQFDLVVSSEVLEHVPDEQKDKFVKNINRLLKSEGFAIISTPRKEAQEEYCKHSRLAQPVEEWMTEENVKELFIKESFCVQNFNRLTRPTAANTTLDIYQLWLFKKTQKKSL